MATLNQVKFTTLDVFTDKPFQGNQLAIIHTPENDLSHDVKQAIAKEFNFSETVFLHNIPSANQQRRVDIFTPEDEIPFAGHPTIGTLCYLGKNPATQSDRMDLLLKAGRLEGRYDPKTGLAEAKIPHSFHIHAANVHRKDFVDPHITTNEDNGECPTMYPVASIVKGMTFALIMIPDLTMLAALQASAQADVNRVVSLDNGWAPSLVGSYYYVIKERPTKGSVTTIIRARMFHRPIGEDPCTGSAASTLACYLSLLDGTPGKTLPYLIEQGADMGRSGELYVTVTLDEMTGSSIHEVVLAGRGVVITDGNLTLPDKP